MGQSGIHRHNLPVIIKQQVFVRKELEDTGCFFAADGKEASYVRFIQ